MIRKSIFLVVLVTASALYGCATIVNDQNMSLSFSSNPSNATVLVNGQEVGTTPVTIQRRRQSTDLRVSIRKEGYKSEETVLSSRVDPIFFGNIITGGLFGSTTDAATGKMWQYKPNQYHATLVPEKKSMRQQWSVRAQTMRFVIDSYDELARDIARGGGEHLRSLYGRLGIDEAGRNVALDGLRGIRRSTDSAPEFARAVLDHLS